MPPDRKRRRTNGTTNNHHTSQNGGNRGTQSHTYVDTSRPTAIFKPSTPTTKTVSIALPSSILTNALTPDAKTSLVSTLSRALAVFRIHEIVIFSDGQEFNTRRFPSNRPNNPNNFTGGGGGRDGQTDYAARDKESGFEAYTDPAAFMHHLLSYAETPPHLRRTLFPVHANLKGAGMMNSLDMPHHLRGDEWCRYREGVGVEEFYSPHFGAEGVNNSDEGGSVNGHGKRKPNASLVDAGFDEQVTVRAAVPQGARATLDFGRDEWPVTDEEWVADAVAPSAPREEGGYYWGYSSRVAKKLSDVFTECPWEGGYTYCVGTSERGGSVADALGRKEREELPEHLLVVFGGQAGLEKAFEADDGLRESGVAEVKDVFDAWVDLLDGNQGSRTVRTEEALWIGCMGLKMLGWLS